MSFNVKKMIDETKPGKIEYPDGSVLNFEYRPNIYTPNHEDTIDAVRDGNKAGDTLKACLIPLLASWDVVETTLVTDPDTGVTSSVEKPIPITEEGFGNIPFKVLGDIMKFIGDDITPGEATTTVSSGSFT